MPKIIEIIDIKPEYVNEDAEEFIQSIKYLLWVSVSVTCIVLIYLCVKRRRNLY
jgi:hypothetical protein